MHVKMQAARNAQRYGQLKHYLRLCTIVQNESAKASMTATQHTYAESKASDFLASSFSVDNC